MIKKIIISIGFLFSFFLMFLLGFDKINVLAYSDIGNALGSYPVKLDIDNYNRQNLLDMCIFYTSNGVVSNGITTTYNEDNCFINSSGIVSNNVQWFNVTPYVDYVLEPGTYTFSANQVLTNLSLVFRFRGLADVYIGSWNDYTTTRTFDVPTTILNIFLETPVNYEVNISNLALQIEKGTEKSDFGVPFKFGYNVNYSLSVNNLTSNQVNAGIGITDANGNYLKTGNCVVPANSSTICSNINDPLYLPFNIDNNGYISFNYSLGLFIGPVGSLSVTPNDSGLNFVPVFNAYYNGSPTNNLYFKDRYTFNNLFLSGFNVSVNSSTLSKVSFPRNQVDSEFSMNTNKIVNFATDKKIETGIYNYINYVDFINSSPTDIYSFVITTGVSSPALFENRIYTISFSNLSLKVNGDTGNVSPLPNNPNTINKYNDCSAWYDIPCQLGNGLTYVIYEAPIISPVLTFIVSFITMFSSLVSFVDLFRSFGIVFGCFIIYMFIELLHKYSK